MTVDSLTAALSGSSLIMAVAGESFTAPLTVNSERL